MASTATPGGSKAESGRLSLGLLPWKHTFVDELPGDKEEGGGPRQVHSALYSRVEPTPSSSEPYLIAHSREAAELLGLDERECSTADFARAFSGKTTLSG